MEKTESITITVEIEVELPLEKVWKVWTGPEHITNWNFASDDWCCPNAANDLQIGKFFLYRMEAKDGSTGFDFAGTYEEIIPGKLITYVMEDGRRVRIVFKDVDGATKISESFDAEDINSAELQKTGWQAILNNFKKYAESL